LCVLLCGSSRGFSDTCVPTPADLAAWWRFENNAVDFQSGTSGNLAGNPIFAPAQVRTGILLDGDGDAVALGNPTNLWLQDFTIEAWVKRSDVIRASKTSPFGVIFGGGYGNYGLFMWNNGDLQLSKGGANNVTVGTSITDTNYHHLAVTKSGSVVVFYVDGVSFPAPAYNPTFEFYSTMQIGSGVLIDGAYTSSFWGGIDELSIFNRPLSASEIASIYLAGSAGKCDPFAIMIQPHSQVGYWGKSVSFQVKALGQDPLTYQWWKNGTPLNNETNTTLVLGNLQMSSGGVYTVTVSSIAGTITSSPAVLTMNPAGVSIASYVGVTIDGVAGLTYGIQSTSELSNTNSWRGLVNLTLSYPTQLWFDLQPSGSPQRYYRVVPGPITIP